jgi:hypothetical protein
VTRTPGSPAEAQNIEVVAVTMSKKKKNTNPKPQIGMHVFV